MKYTDLKSRKKINKILLALAEEIRTDGISYYGPGGDEPDEEMLDMNLCDAKDYETIADHIMHKNFARAMYTFDGLDTANREAPVMLSKDKLVYLDMLFQEYGSRWKFRLGAEEEEQ